MPSTVIHRTRRAGKGRRAIATMHALESRVLLAVQLPAGFQQSVLTQGIDLPTSMAFAPDGRLFVTQQNGLMREIKNGSLLAQPFLSLSVDTVLEHGLTSVAFDPAFATNHYFYVYYTPSSDPTHSRISRFTVSSTDPDQADPSSELVLLGDIPTPGYHGGGGLCFGKDGCLYLGIGDGQATPATAVSQDLSSLGGKIIRIDPTRANTVPADNPFVNTAGARPEIYAYGMRNPFTSAVDPITGKLFFNDVGNRAWEEVDNIQAGKNYGWPAAEGNSTNPAFASPVYDYAHSGPATAITGGAFYRANQFPTSYIGEYFFADYLHGFIRALDPNTGRATDFATGADGPMGLAVGPDGSLYYLSAQTNAGAYAPNSGTKRAVYKISYTGTPGPFARAPYAGTSSAVPGLIEAENFDAGGEGITYHDGEPQNLGGAYRPSDGVDIQPTTDTGAGYNVGWTKAGEWMEYSINVASTAPYSLSLRVASAGQGGTCHFLVDGQKLTGAIAIPNSGGWQQWQTLRVPVQLTAGLHTLRLVMDSNGASGFVGNFNYLNLAGPRDLLIYSATAGPRHGFTSQAVSIVQDLATQSGFTVDATEDPTAFTDANLSRYKAVIFMLNVGDILNAQQQTALQHFIESGKGFVGIHSAADSLHRWAWYGQLVGAFVSSNTPVLPATFNILTNAHPSTAGLPATLSWSDEWYNFTPNPKANGVTVLANLDESTYTGGKMGADHPIMWYHRFDGGRSWYVDMGDTLDIFSNSYFRQMVLGGIQYALAPDTPFSVGDTIQAEDFNGGGEGIGHHDTEPANLGGAYRTLDGVDIQATSDPAGGLYNVGWTHAGEWLNYSMNVATAGQYTLSARVASTAAGATFHVEFNGVDQTGPLTVPNTGGWQTWQTITRTVTLSPGPQTMRIVFDTNASNGFAGNLNWVKLS